MHGYIQKIWACYTTCDDRLIVEEIRDKVTNEIYFIVSELSMEINKSYTYKKSLVPQVIKDIIVLCELKQCHVHKEITKQVVYGPHILRKIGSIPIIDLNLDFFEKEKEFFITYDDDKIKLFYKWLQQLLLII